jgi:hypothetical protein
MKYRHFGIIDRIKLFIRKKLMSKKNYLVQVDTTESTTRNGLPPGILNSFIVRALDPFHAKQIVLRIYNRRVAEQIQTSLYVYELEDIMKNLATIDEQNGVPLFSFMPLQGGRPPRQADVTTSSLGNNTIAPNQPEPPIQQQPPVVRGSQSPRSQEFNNVDNGRPTTTNRLTPEQDDLVRRLGARPTPTGSDERVNTRVNAATGLTRNQSVVDAEQSEILARLGVNPNASEVVDPELEREIQQAKGLSIEDTSLQEINEAPLDEASLKALENELDKGI